MDKGKDVRRRVKELEAQLAHARQDRDHVANELALYRTAIENTRDGIVLIGADGKLIFCNDRYREFYRPIAEHIVPGAHIGDIIRVSAHCGHVLNSGDDIDSWISTRLEILREGTGNPYFLEFGDGTWLRASNYRTPGGDTLGIRTDVTQLKRREIELRTAHDETRSRLDAFFAHAPVAMFIKDAAGRLTTVNPAFESWFGVKAADVLGRTAAESMPWFPSGVSETPDREILDGGEARSIEFDLTRPDRGAINAVVTKFPIQDTAGKIVAIAGVILDLSAFKRTEKNLAQKTLILESTFDAIDHGVAFVNGEMRIVACNDRFLEMMHYEGPVPESGIPVIDTLEASARAGGYGAGDPRDLAKRRYEELLRTDLPSREQRTFPGGRIMELRRQPVPGGGYVSTCTDITELKETEASAERARQILHDTIEALPASIALYDAEGRMAWCNSPTRTLFHWQPDLHEPGVTYEEQIGNSVHQGLIPEAAGREDAWIQERVNQFHASATNLETAQPDGKWFLSSFRKTAGGGTVVIRHDISDRKEGERALRESEANFRSLIESSLIGMCIAQGSQLLFANRGFAGIFGYDDPGELLYRDAIETLLAPDEQKKIGRGARSFLMQKPLQGTIEAACVRKDGSQIWVQIAANPIVWDGRPATHATLTDITERRQADDQLRTALFDAESANRGKSDFLARMSHELRTPLNAIIGFSEVMNMETFGSLGNERYRDYAEDILRSGHLLLELINDVLDMSKIEAGRYDLSIEDVALPPLIQEVIHILHGQIERKRLTLDCPVDGAAELVRADRRAMRQILLNLASNAIKFTPEGGNITIATASLPDGGFQLSVADTGIGIEPADISRILEPFAQVGPAQTADQPGTGLGLPIVRSLAELHGGRIRIESEPGKGASVFVEIPRDEETLRPAAAGYR